jgi:hypothetical protein
VNLNERRIGYERSAISSCPGSGSGEDGLIRTSFFVGEVYKKKKRVLSMEFWEQNMGYFINY